MIPDLRALSFSQPWLWCTLYLGKNLDNRSRNLGSYRGRLLLHASAQMSLSYWREVFEFIDARFGVEVSQRLPKWWVVGPGGPNPAFVLGAVLGVADVVNQCSPGPAWAESTSVPCDMRWYMGEHGYLLTNTRVLPRPVPCKGALGFWRPRADVVRAVEEQL